MVVSVHQFPSIELSAIKLLNFKLIASYITVQAGGGHRVTDNNGNSNNALGMQISFDDVKP